MTRRLRVLIADNAGMRRGLRMLLDGEVEFCAEADDAAEAIRAAKREQPDACVVGREIVGERLAAIRGIARAAPNAAVVVFAEHGNADEMLDAVRAGATGYLVGTLDALQLVRVMRAVAEHEAVIPRAMVRDLVLELRLSEDLTRRESQVLGMLHRGRTTSDIAHRLDISPITVRRHVADLVRKLGVEDRAALALSETQSGADAGMRRDAARV